MRVGGVRPNTPNTLLRKPRFSLNSDAGRVNVNRQRALALVDVKARDGSVAQRLAREFARRVDLQRLAQQHGFGTHLCHTTS